MTVLVLDCDNLLSRAWHAAKQDSRLMLMMFFRDLRLLQQQFATERMAFCFDSTPLSKRRGVYPAYKANRPSPTNEEEARLNEKWLDVASLREKYLPALGYRNIFRQNGYEADDLIASVVQGTDQDCIIVSSDRDMLQLLSGSRNYNPLDNRVRVWRPALGKIKGEMVTQQTFRDKYGISSRSWAKVKAIAGCVSDNIKGVPGVGEHFAIKYIKGELNHATKAYAKIKAAEASGLIARNMELVRLPYPGTQACPLVEDKPSKKAWGKLMKELGFNSLRTV